MRLPNIAIAIWFGAVLLLFVLGNMNAHGYVRDKSVPRRVSSDPIRHLIRRSDNQDAVEKLKGEAKVERQSEKGHR